MNTDPTQPSEATVVVEPCEQINRVSNDPDQIARCAAVARVASLKVQNVDPDVHGCSTVIVRGLSLQLIEELNKIVPNALASFAHLNVDFGDAVNPFLQPLAIAALKRAIARRPGKKMFVNSAYRTIAQQLLLFNQGQRGQCGIGLVAAPGQSNHQSGLALDIEDAHGWRPFLEDEGWQWLGPQDVPHFDFVGGGTKDIRQAAILAFQVLWDRHNPGDSINDGGFYGPQTEARLNRSPVDGFGGFISTKTTPGATTGTTARMLELQTPLMEGEDVLKVQKALINAGFNVGANGADRLYGVETANAVKEFQQQKGLTVDGKVGAETAKGLDGVRTVSTSTQLSTQHPAELAPELPRKLLRYPYLDCPDKAIIHQTFTLTVELVIEMPEPSAAAVAIAIQDSGTTELPEIEVVLRVQNFDIKDSNKKVMQVERDVDSVVTFDLTPTQTGEQQLRVDFYQHGRRIGTARRNLLVTEQLLSQKVQQPDTSVVLELKATATVPPPDLELCVILDRHDSQKLYYELHSVKPELDYHHTRVGQVTLQASPLEKMQAVWRELSNLAALKPNTQTSSDEQRTLVPRSSTTQISPERAERRLTTVGNQLWDELVSDELKQQYWQFKEHVKSILITSDEPWVPWEMIKPYRHVNGKEEQDPFWCQQFAISRWLSGPGTADDLPAKVVLPVAPAQSNLSSVQEEIAFLAQLTSLRSGLSPVMALDRGLDLEDYIRDKEFSILHFACHGMFDDTSPNDSAIVLADGPLRPSDLRLYFDQKQPRPLIFINACHGGRVGFSFTGLGGWAERLVKARVGAFVGAMWEVNDTLALQFARTFYKALLQDNQTVAEAFRQSREAIRQIAPYNSTWLAYSLYADPEARIQADPEITVVKVGEL